MIKDTNIQKREDAYVFEYPHYAKMADTQLDIFWPWSEIKVEKDKQDLLVGMTEAETHGAITTLKLFTKYELFVGEEYWLGRVLKRFPRHEIQRMASAFGNVELNSHGPFYSRINEELGLATKEFYNSYVENPVLKERMEFISYLVDSEDDLLSLAGFSMIEGAVLYSNFAYLKHFQTRGKNKIPNICRGLDMSVRDENLHSLGGATLFSDLKKESQLTEEEEKFYQAKILELAMAVRSHEHQIVEMLFEKGPVEGITEKDLKVFVDSRINICLEQLGYAKLFEVTDNTVADWFYDGINKYMMNDFFQGIGREYVRNWNTTGFVWKVE